MAEWFRDATGKDTLLFVDNIFRFSQAGSEVSALLGRMPSAVGYQPTLATEMGELQERITSTNRGAITSVQAVYVPADDPTDPAPANAFQHLDAFLYLERRISELRTLMPPEPGERRAETEAKSGDELRRLDDAVAAMAAMRAGIAMPLTAGDRVVGFLSCWDERVPESFASDEIAALLEVNEKTVRRHWEVAKVRLFQRIQEAR